MKKKLLIIVITAVVVVLPGTHGQSAQNPEGLQKVDAVMALVEEEKNEPAADSLVELRLEQVRYKFWTLVIIICATIMFLFIVLGFLARTQKITTADVVSLSSLVLVIQAILVSVVVALTSEQLTAAIGALGAIAGYLFGKTRSRMESQEPNTA